MIDVKLVCETEKYTVYDSDMYDAFRQM